VLNAKAGDVIFLVGPNGAGKSALIQYFAASLKGIPFKHIAAHRQNWSSSSVPDVAPSSRIAMEASIQNYSRNEEARWRDDYGSHRASIVLAGLIASENRWSRDLAASCIEKGISPTTLADKNPSPLTRLNRILARGALTARIELSPAEEVLARHSNGTPFGFSRLSDGGRNAVLLCSEIISTPDGVAFLVDEPPRGP
jgi:ATPase subunit of ABC transporter with duplicated ATPase domains